MVAIGDSLEVNRDVDAFLIPSGTPVVIPDGQVVLVTQALGGSYTVHVQGNLLRIHAKDADALGIETATQKAKKKIYQDDYIVDEDDIWEQCRTVFDPEIPVSIAELGLIYKIEIERSDDSNWVHVEVVMTLTAPGCGMGPILVQDLHDAILSIDNVQTVNVELVFDPPWDQTMMTEAAQLQLGLL